MSGKYLLDFLHKRDTRIVAQRILEFQSKNIKIEKASDFDIFNILCEKLYLIYNHPLRKEFLNLLSQASFTDIKPLMLYDLVYRKKLWQKIFVDANIELPISYKTYDSLDYLECSQNYTCSIEANKSNHVLNLNFVVDTSAENMFDNIFSLLEYTMKKISAESVEELFFDVDKIQYARPDNFHAQKEYESLKCGGEDTSTILLWLLCRILMNSDLKLNLKANNVEKAESVLALIYRFGLSPTIAIDVDISNVINYSDFYELLLRYSKKNISLRLSCSKEIENLDIILNILNVIPLAFIESMDINFENIKIPFSLMLAEREVMYIISHLYKAE